MPQLTAAAIRRAYGETEWRRGESYAEAGRVGPIRRQALEDGSELISAEVRGGRRIPWQTEALLHRDGRIESSCSCPVGAQCKHAAALLWQALGPAPPPPAYSQVLATLREAAAATPVAAPEAAPPPPPPPHKSEQYMLFAGLDARPPRHHARATNWCCSPTSTRAISRPCCCGRCSARVTRAACG